MDGNTMLQAFEELFPYLESLETRSDAILQLLRDKDQVTDEQLAPYLEQAGNASNIKWLGARKRIEYLLSSTERDTEKSAEARTERAADLPSAEDNSKKSADKNLQKDGDEFAKNVHTKTDTEKRVGENSEISVEKSAK